MELQVEYVPVSQLVAYKNNARRHSDRDVDAIVASIREFGFSDPIGVWRGNVIVEGHGRLLAAKKLGMEYVPVVRLDHMSDKQRRAYSLAHNRTAELSEWDIDVKAAEIAELADFDMSEFGFDAPELSISGDEGEEPQMEEAELTDYQYVHFLVTVDAQDADRFRAPISQLKQMGAVVKETKNCT